jgi:hypothetical protein
VARSLNSSTDVREITFIPPALWRAVMMSSWITVGEVLVLLVREVVERDDCD